MFLSSPYPYFYSLNLPWLKRCELKSPSTNISLWPMNPVISVSLILMLCYCNIDIHSYSVFILIVDILYNLNYTYDFLKEITFAYVLLFLVVEFCFVIHCNVLSSFNWLDLGSLHLLIGKMFGLIKHDRTNILFSPLS